LDLGSTNGTKINGQKIVQEQLLVNGDELAFGTSGAKFEIS
jgi:pSer/pThr/pTyr-binding forkhead associated (FHA) protein